MLSNFNFVNTRLSYMVSKKALAKQKLFWLQETVDYGDTLLFY
jgi:hypothetical protein